MDNSNLISSLFIFLFLEGTILRGEYNNVSSFNLYSGGHSHLLLVHQCWRLKRQRFLSCHLLLIGEKRSEYNLFNNKRCQKVVMYNRDINNNS